jgi:hypothetical protein
MGGQCIQQVADVGWEQTQLGEAMWFVFGGGWGIINGGVLERLCCCQLHLASGVVALCFLCQVASCQVEGM